ncbi:MAG: hypothetical protein AAGA21_02930 [Pseudomonadota bacterium]
MGPLIGALMAGGAGGIFGGAGGGGLLGGLLGNFLSNGGLGGLLSSLFGGQQPGGAAAGRGNEETNQLLGDIKDMLSELLGKEDGAGKGDCAGGSHGASKDACDKGSGIDDDHGCSSSCHGSDDAGWDGKDKSPSLDREQGAARLLEQAKHTDDPKEKRELIEMALEMLGDGPEKKKGLLSDVINDMRERQDGNSYDKDIVKQAEKMLEQIDDGCLSDCAESKALDSVIDMLMEEGGVDGKPASSDTNGNGRQDGCEGLHDGPPHFIHHHLHSALYNPWQ